MEGEKISKPLLIVNGVSLALCVLLIFGVYEKSHQGKVTQNKTAETQKTVAAFPAVVLIAKAAVVYDLMTHTTLFAKDADRQLPLASLTKVMTALTASDMIPKDSHITVRKEFLAEEGDSGLSPDEAWTMRNLLDYSLVVSSNDGARSIASAVGAYHFATDNTTLGRKDFIGAMNTKATSLGFSSMYFLNETGLDEGSTISGGYGSPEDVAKLFGYTLSHYPTLLEATTKERGAIASLSKVHDAHNTNIVANKIPGLLASKTGYTALAGGNLTIVFDAGLNHPIAVVVLGSSESGRFSDTLALVSATRTYLTK